MIQSVDHLHIYAADPRATIAFYERCFGAEYLGSIPSNVGEANHGVMLGGQLLVISEFPPGMAPKPAPEPSHGALRSGFGVAHIGLQTEDLDGVVRALAREGVEVHNPPKRAGAVRYVYATAPDGVVVEIVELHLPPTLARLRPVLRLTNKAIHTTRRLLAKQVFK